MKQRFVFLLIGFGLLILGTVGIGFETLLELTRLDYLHLESQLALVFTTIFICAIGKGLLGINFIWLLCFISIPLGLIWSINELITTLTGLEDMANLAYRVPNVILPAFISGVFCALAYFSEAVE